jgi:dihydrofolate reductase
MGLDGPKAGAIRLDLDNDAGQRSALKHFLIVSGFPRVHGERADHAQGDGDDLYENVPQVKPEGANSQKSHALVYHMAMSKLRVSSFGVSLDGYGAGPHQDFENPLGVGGRALLDWAMGTRTFRRIFGEDGGSTGVDEEFAARGFAGIGAWIMGRNMFGPIRGEWPDDVWKGWWGDDPPFHTPVFVLTRYPRSSITMDGGTTFHFVTDGIDAALERAMEAANGADVRLSGGVATIRQFLLARLVDELHLAVAPVLLGSGESLLHGIDLPKLDYVCDKVVRSENATHVVITKSD